MKAYKAFELNVSNIKKLVRKRKNPLEPVEFTITVDAQKFKFTLFENDVLSDDFVLYMNGKPHSKKAVK